MLNKTTISFILKLTIYEVLLFRPFETRRRRLTLTRKRKKNWTKNGVLLALFLGLLGIAVTILTSNWNKSDKEFSIIGIILLGYILYNLLSK